VPASVVAIGNVDGAIAVEVARFVPKILIMAPGAKLAV
jgi:hypothetical protein